MPECQRALTSRLERVSIVKQICFLKKLIEEFDLVSSHFVMQVREVGGGVRFRQKE